MRLRLVEEGAGRAGGCIWRYRAWHQFHWYEITISEAPPDPDIPWTAPPPAGRPYFATIKGRTGQQRALGYFKDPETALAAAESQVAGEGSGGRHKG